MIKVDKIIVISDKENKNFDSQLIVEQIGNEFIIKLNSSEIVVSDIKGYDYYDCLLKLRQLLETRNLFLLCQGSARNVHLSRLGRDMSDGLKAYSVQMGRKVLMENLVNIFDPASVSEVRTIADQEVFFQEWLNQPKS